MTESNLVHAVAVEIQDTVTLHILQKGSVAGFEDIETWRRQRLMQEVFRILIEDGSRRCVQVLCLPRRSLRGNIEFAFGAQIIQWFHVVHLETFFNIWAHTSLVSSDSHRD